MYTTSAQIDALTAISGIAALKHNDWRACDATDVDAFQKSFIADGAVIDHGVCSPPAERAVAPIRVRQPRGSTTIGLLG